ncbi:MAG: indole-3-glycerol phosphate synthase [Flavobacteriaceae bacterium]|nr:indole-3-glycerol phosphate synthase [Flavobacteriaceae bacterium]
MNILERITKTKKAEIQAKKGLFSSSFLEQSPLFNRSTLSISKALKKSSSGIIAEHKRRSPSKAVINQSHQLLDVISAYQANGATAISVLTDTNYFGGSLEDLFLAKSIASIPLLRKDFVIDPYQITEAKAFGADFILLIASILDKVQIQEFTAFAHKLNLEVLLEVHSLEELEASYIEEINVVGVNNRNLKTFEVDLNTSFDIAKALDPHKVKISESGLNDTQSIINLKKAGYNGFLIGEMLMKNNAPGIALKQLIEQS